MDKKQAWIQAIQKDVMTTNLIEDVALDESEWNKGSKDFEYVFLLLCVEIKYIDSCDSYEVAVVSLLSARNQT